MTRRRLILLVALVALAIAAWATEGFGLWREGGDGDTLVLHGNVEVREVKMAFRVPGRIATLSVEEGERVAEGDLLAVLDAAPVEDRVAQAEADIAQAQANLARLENGNRVQDITAARARVDAAAARLAQAQDNLTRREPLVAAGAISDNVWSETQAAHRTAEAALREAQAALSLQQAGARGEDVAAARAALARAQAARAATGTDLGDTRLAAAGPGIVATRAAEPGSLVQPGETVLTIAIDRPLRIRAYVGEPDLSRVRPGMAANVTVDGNSRVYRARVGYISPRAEFTPRTVETEDLRADLVYQVRLIVDDPDEGLRQGQPVTVTLATPTPAPKPASTPASGE
jgi:HlyD family secretion protein